MELRKARMFAAAEAFYVDRRLVGNVFVSYFDGPKAGTDEVMWSLMRCCVVVWISGWLALWLSPALTAQSQMRTDSQCLLGGI